MFRFLLFLFVVTFSSAYSFAHYPLKNDPIDIVIPCHEKDLPILEYCIEGAKQNVKNVRRIIVISEKRFTDLAEWFDESFFPFTKHDLIQYLGKTEKEKERIGWYYQQLLKLYSPFVIPEISENVLVIDSDTVFLNPVSFLNENNGGQYCTGNQNHRPYFFHSNKLLGLTRIWNNRSGIAHHMLFQKPILEDLFSQIEEKHNLETWRAFCLCVDPKEVKGAGASEYEIYFNFAFKMTNQVSLRPLKWENINSVKLIEKKRSEGYHFVSCHSYMRKP